MNNGGFVRMTLILNVGEIVCAVVFAVGIV